MCWGATGNLPIAHLVRLRSGTRLTSATLLADLTHVRNRFDAPPAPAFASHAPAGLIDPPRPVRVVPEQWRQARDQSCVSAAQSTVSPDLISTFPSAWNTRTAPG